MDCPIDLFADYLPLSYLKIIKIKNMKHYLFFFFAILLTILISNNSFSQTITDNQLWSGASAKLKLNKKFSISLAEQFRFKNNISTKKLSFTEMGIKYKLNKHFSFATKYRYVAIPIKKNKRRISFDVYYSWKKKNFPLSLKYRFRLQDTKKFNSTKQKADYLRNKLTLGYNASKLVDPFIAYELYFRFDNKNEFRAKRFTFGLAWRLNKRINLTTYYRIQKDINVKKPEKLNIIGLNFAYNISLKKLKKVMTE